jgi:hypothetical protein
VIVINILGFDSLNVMSYFQVFCFGYEYSFVLILILEMWYSYVTFYSSLFCTNILQLLEFWEGDMVLSIAKYVPAGLHIYQTLTGKMGMKT